MNKVVLGYNIIIHRYGIKFFNKSSYDVYWDHDMIRLCVYYDSNLVVRVGIVDIYSDYLKWKITKC